MDRFELRHHRNWLTVALALGVTAGLHALPLNAVLRLDRLLYDSLSTLSAAPAPADVVLVELDDPSGLTALMDAAARAGARSLTTTVPEPPSDAVNDYALGPTGVPLGDALLEPTDWRRGGHLWVRPEADGVVRQDLAWLDGSHAMPSLAAAAARHAGTAGAGGAGPAGLGDRVRLDGARRHWLAFYEPDSFEVAVGPDALADTALRDRHVVAGTRRAAFVTPLGRMADFELVAQAFAGYRAGRGIQTAQWANLLGWALAAAALAVLWRGYPRPRTLRCAMPIAAAAALPVISGAAFLGASLWMPVTGPVVLLLSAGAIYATLTRTQRAPQPGPRGEAQARRLAASGRLVKAWSVYKDLPLNTAALDELFDLGTQLEAAGHEGHAADVFHRIAQADPGFRDVTKRLAASSGQPETGAPGIRPKGPIPSLPAALGRYELLEVIGYGTTGQVYLGRDPKINRILAIKVVDLSVEYDAEELDEVRGRFLREAETAGRLNHPNIVTIYDIGESDGLAYIAMEYLKGRHMSDFAVPGKLLPARKVLALMARIADAIHAAHGQNIVHRDIKPANIMYDSVSDSVKITDFGIARLIGIRRTQTGVVLGTPSFMAPEQLEGGNVNGHTDLFALGVTLYQLLTGQLPFRGSSMTKLMYVIANEPHLPVTKVRPDLPPQLDELFDRALAKEPEDRFYTGAEMAEALRQVAAQMA